MPTIPSISGAGCNSQGLAPEKNPRKIYVPRHVYADYLAERA